MKTVTTVIVKLSVDGMHNFPKAAELFPEVAFLADRHRHMFNFTIAKQVFHDDRDVEFIQAKRIMERWYADGTLQLDYKSCEMMAKDLYNKCISTWPDRDYVIEVSEDKENGCRMYFSHIKGKDITPRMYLKDE